jgi:hypothetical protein
MNAPTGRIPSFRLPAWTWVFMSVLTTPFAYFFLRESSHAASPTALENLFLIVYAILLGLNFSFAFKNRDVIYHALPAWLVPTWRRILAYVAVALSMQLATATLPLPDFYREALGRSVFFLLVPYFCVSAPGTMRGRFLSAALNPKISTDPAIIDSERELTFRYNPRKAIFVIVVGLAFVLVGIFIRHQYPVAGWSCVCFFGLVSLIGSLVFVPGSTRLIVNDEGFVMIHLWRRYQLRWTEVRDFELVTLPPGTKFVAFDFTNEVSPTSPQWQKRLARGKHVREMFGKDAVLPTSYNVSPEDLCHVMVQRQVRALRATT